MVLPILAAFAKPEGAGSKRRVYANSVTGPTSYSTGGFTVSTTLDTIEFAIVVLRNNPGNKVIQYRFSGNTITIQIFTISASTTTGAISATEDAAGTNESSLIFDIIAVGY